MRHKHAQLTWVVARAGVACSSRLRTRPTPGMGDSMRTKLGLRWPPGCRSNHSKNSACDGGARGAMRPTATATSDVSMRARVMLKRRQSRDFSRQIDARSQSLLLFVADTFACICTQATYSCMDNVMDMDMHMHMHLRYDGVRI